MAVFMCNNWVPPVTTPPVVSEPIYGVSGLYQESPALTRTDDAVGLSFAINSGTGSISSDFNSVFPWNEATVETISGNKFLHMPAMWFRVGFDESKRITDVAVSKAQGATGNWYHVDSFYYGCYGGSVNDNKLCSVSGVARQGYTGRNVFRNYATTNGDGYFQRDLYHDNVMLFLWWIEWATKNSASIMTGRIKESGTSAGSSVRATGGTDSVSTPSGFETAYAQMRWHYIEDFVGNCVEFIDGIVGSGSSYYVTASSVNFGDTTANHSVLSYGYPANASSTERCIKAMGWDVNNPFLCQPIEQGGVDYDVYFCDGNGATNNNATYRGSHYPSSNETYGLTHTGRITTNGGGIIGLSARLLYKPTT